MTMELRDLMPKGDVKGGNPPKSPYPPMEVSEFSERTSKAYPIIISILSTGLIGMTVAWWTALSERGVTRRDMEEYVRLYSPYVIDKAGIAEHQSNQDKEIARLGANQLEVLRRLDKLESGRDGAPSKN